VGRTWSSDARSTDPKATPPPASPTVYGRQKGVRVFTYPKVVFFVPTLIAALICSIGMWATRAETRDPRTVQPERTTITVEQEKDASSRVVERPNTSRFTSTQNILGMVFLTIFGLNLMVMSIDFPRFTVIALVLLFAALGFFVLWLNVYFDLIPPLVRFLERVYAVANAEFYFLVATVILVNFGIIWITRYLDYWEFLPNEILHNHGPFSDLERYPTTNLKFDKEIPDILEYALLRSGRLVLHIPGQPKAMVLDNVLWINSKEEQLKKLMSRMEVRITTDQEAATDQTLG
jgi:hypothetical protein